MPDNVPDKRLGRKIPETETVPCAYCGADAPISGAYKFNPGEPFCSRACAEASDE